MPEEMKMYMDAYHGQFSKKLAEWAISRMRIKKPVGDPMGTTSVKLIPLEVVEQVLKKAGVDVPDECIYTAWYLYHMTIADYRRSLDDDNRRAWYIDETLNDPDGKPSDVLACFRAKCDNAGVPIMWERMI